MNTQTRYDEASHQWLTDPAPDEAQDQVELPVATELSPPPPKKQKPAKE